MNPVSNDLIFQSPVWLTHLHGCSEQLCFGRIQLLSFKSFIPHYFVPTQLSQNIWVFDVFTHSKGFPNSHLLHENMDLTGRTGKPQYVSRFLLENINKTNYLQLEYWDEFRKVGWNNKEVASNNSTFNFRENYREKLWNTSQKQLIYQRTGIVVDRHYPSIYS